MAEGEFDHKQYINLMLEKAGKFYTCLRGPRPSGAIVVNLEKQLVYGSVAPPLLLPTCKDLGECEMENGHCVRTIHAEVRAIVNCAVLGMHTRNATLYSVNKPCYQCMKVIAAANINRIVYIYTVYDEPRTQAIIDACNIEMIKWPPPITKNVGIIEEDILDGYYIYTQHIQDVKDAK